VIGPYNFQKKKFGIKFYFSYFLVLFFMEKKMKSLAFGLERENYYSGHTSGLVLEVSNDTLSVEEEGRTTCCPPH
jgi:hypothetical protein